jgi:hypothetical protein
MTPGKVPRDRTGEVIATKTDEDQQNDETAVTAENKPMNDLARRRSARNDSGIKILIKKRVRDDELFRSFKTTSCEDQNNNIDSTKISIISDQ